MYIDWSKLWKLLIDKDMTKTDLLELTGISSRVLAKLSKNETVTTDTVARICSALNCDVGDVMECVSEERLSIYLSYKKFGICEEENEQLRVVRFNAGGRDYVVYESKAVAKKSTHIHCESDGAVYWEQLCQIGTIATGRTRRLLVKPPRGGDACVIVLIKGKPGVIVGLDENGFVAARSFRKKETDIFVMSEAAFKVFASA